MTGQDGLSIVEMLIPLLLMLTVTTTLFSLLDPEQNRFATQLEASDAQQRLRVAGDTIGKALTMAGAGSYQGASAGALNAFFAPVLPYRRGSDKDDPPGSFRSDTITLMWVPSTPAQTTLSTFGPDSNTSSVGVNIGPGCPVGDALCG